MNTTAAIPVDALLEMLERDYNIVLLKARIDGKVIEFNSKPVAGTPEDFTELVERTIDAALSDFGNVSRLNTNDLPRKFYVNDPAVNMWTLNKYTARQAAYARGIRVFNPAVVDADGTESNCGVVLGGNVEHKIKEFTYNAVYFMHMQASAGAKLPWLKPRG